MTPRELAEYRALRSTIRERGTARVWVFVAGIAAWAALGLATALLVDTPLSTLVPLLMLAATFEAVFALHVGVERVGRYLQVFHEMPDEKASWESLAMSLGPPARGTATDPLFVVVFAVATALNFLPILIVSPVPVELVTLGALHLLFLARLLTARSAAARQRAADLARFTEMKGRALQ